MPSNWLYVDTNFPTFTGQESTEAKVSTIQNYLFMLVEQLRYSLHNLDTGNMNPSALNRYANGLTDPIYRKLSDSEGNITQLQIDAKGLQMQITNNAGDIHNLSITAGNLASQIKDANGNISSLQQTADKIQTQVSNNAGDISSLQQTANSISSTVSSQGGQISQIQQTANKIQTQVSNNAGDISILQQTADSISSTVTSLSGDVSRIRQTVNSITLSVTNGENSSLIGLYRDGVLVSSQNIVLNGTVTFTDLSGYGRPTVISGGLIETSTLRVNQLYGDSIAIKDSSGGIAGWLYANSSSSAFGREALQFQADAIRMTSYNGDIYLNAQHVTLAGVQGNTCQGDFYPSSSGMYNCGTWGFPWNTVYTKDGNVSASDKLWKFDIDYDMSRYSALFDRLRPCSFRRRNGESYRAHTGLIAQDVDKAREAAGLPDSEFAAYCAWEAHHTPGEPAGEAGCGLRYEEFIALLIYEVQTLKRQVKDLRAGLEPVSGPAVE